MVRTQTPPTRTHHRGQRVWQTFLQCVVNFIPPRPACVAHARRPCARAPQGSGKNAKIAPSMLQLERTNLAPARTHHQQQLGAFTTPYYPSTQPLFLLSLSPIFPFSFPTSFTHYIFSCKNQTNFSSFIFILISNYN